jgi:ligand-binding SRPBCC domain-containing protein
MLYRLERTQRLRVDLCTAWAFFSDPRNLSTITPPWLDFQIRSPLPERVHPGLIIVYSVRPLFGVPVRWVTEITHVVEPVLFVDEQRFGPYRFWHHQHLFRAVPGGIEMTDLVHYLLPFGLLGRLVHRLLVARQLQRIFDFRRDWLAQHFGGL